MAKVKFDVSGSDPDEAVGGNFEPPKPGVYKCKVFDVNSGFKKGDDGKPDKSAPRLEVVYEVQDKAYKGSRLFDYISFGESSQWKLDQFLQAFGLATKKKRKGTFDTDDVKGELCKVRVKADTYNGEYSAKVGAVMALAEDEDADEDEEDEEEEDEEIEDEDEEDEDEEEEEEEDDEEEAEDDYDDWGIPALRKELRDRELDDKGKKQQLIDRLREDDGGDPF